MLVMLCAILVLRTAALAQERDVPGKPIGNVSVTENLILMELDQSALGQQNLFDLGQRTLRFTLGSGGYRIENFPLRWDADFGQALSRHQVALHKIGRASCRERVWSSAGARCGNRNTITDSTST